MQTPPPARAARERHKVAEFWERAHELVDPRSPRDKRQEGIWAVRPNGQLLELCREQQAVAVVEVAPELDPLAEALVASARRAGRVLLTAADDRIHADQIPGLSQFFGCQPLFPHQWAIALTAALVATLVVRRIN